MRTDIYFSGLIILIVGIIIFGFEAIATVIIFNNPNPQGMLAQSTFLFVYGKLFRLIGAIIGAIGIALMIYGALQQKQKTI